MGDHFTSLMGIFYTFIWFGAAVSWMVVIGTLQ